MGSIFHFDGPVFRLIELFADLVLLNLLTIALCIPVITGGAAITALHDAVLHMTRETDNYLIRNYWKSFRGNLKRGIILWIPMFCFFAAMVFNAWLVKNNPAAFPAAAKMIFGVGFLLIFAVIVWIFPLLSHFEYESSWSYIRNAALLAVGRLPRTAAMVVITALPLIFLYLQPYKAIAWLVILGFSLPVWIKAWIYGPAFKAMEPTDTTGTES